MHTICRMKQNRKERAASELRQRVLTLELLPGQPLDEVELAELYGLSRTPLREILQRLVGEGYLSAEANKGTSVTSMDLATMRNFFQSAPMIYAAIARLATEHATPASLAELKKIQHRFANSVKQNDCPQMSLGNHQFHEQLGAMANSPYLVPSLERLMIDHTRMSHRFYDQGDEHSRQRTQQACEQHDAMIDAIERRAPADTVAQTIDHWELSRAEMDKYVMPDSLPIDGIHHQRLEGVT